MRVTTRGQGPNTTSTSTSTNLINYFNNEGSVDVKGKEKKINNNNNNNNNVKIKEDLIAREEEKILINRFGD